MLPWRNTQHTTYGSPFIPSRWKMYNRVDMVVSIYHYYHLAYNSKERSTFSCANGRTNGIAGGESLPTSRGANTRIYTRNEQQKNNNKSPLFVIPYWRVSSSSPFPLRKVWKECNYATEDRKTRQQSILLVVCLIFYLTTTCLGVETKLSHQQRFNPESQSCARNS